MSNTPKLTFTPFDSLKEIDADVWQQHLAEPHSPFTDYEFLWALEHTGCVGADSASGWIPRYHLAGNGTSPSGALLLFERWNSYGEYIFDWEWARAYQHYGLAYYPKLTSAIPFTPVTVPKILGTEKEAALQQTIKTYQQDQRYSSLHGLFLNDQELNLWLHQETLERDSIQFHWHNRAYQSFDEFSNELVSKRRRQVARERRQFECHGLTTRTLTCNELTPEVADWMYQFYQATIEKKFSQFYLNRQFFETIFATMKDRVVLFLSQNHGKPVGGSLCFYKGQKLYGRYWGALEEWRHMHFELCYYRPIEFAISHKLKLFEAGAQGFHKVQRGFEPVVTKSAHHLREPQFHAAIKRYLSEERGEINRAIQQLKESSPYAKTPK